MRQKGITDPCLDNTVISGINPHLTGASLCVLLGKCQKRLTSAAARGNMPSLAVVIRQWRASAALGWQGVSGHGSGKPHRPSA
jgi:hypothetical protein